MVTPGCPVTGTGLFDGHALPSVPSAQTCEKVDGFAVQNPTVAGPARGDTWHASSATDASCAYPNPDGSLRYIGTETGTVTLDGYGTGLAVIAFDGLVMPPEKTANALVKRLSASWLARVPTAWRGYPGVEPPRRPSPRTTALTASLRERRTVPVR